MIQNDVCCGFGNQATSVTSGFLHPGHFPRKYSFQIDRWERCNGDDTANAGWTTASGQSYECPVLPNCSDVAVGKLVT
jgi:hypothetical protein